MVIPVAARALVRLLGTEAEASGSGTGLLLASWMLLLLLRLLLLLSLLLLVVVLLLLLLLLILYVLCRITLGRRVLGILIEVLLPLSRSYGKRMLVRRRHVSCADQDTALLVFLWLLCWRRRGYWTGNGKLDFDKAAAVDVQTWVSPC